MNNTHKKGAVWTALAVLVLLGACKNSFLDVPVTGSLNPGLLTSRSGVETSLIAVYSQVNGRGTRMASPSNWVWGSIRGGEANKGTDPGDYSDINPAQRYELIPTSAIGIDKWNGNYEGVARANNTLRLLQTPGADLQNPAGQLIATNVTAQLKFLRAHYYFELVRGFGMVPYVDESYDYLKGIESVKNDTDVYPKIVSDMRYAVANLPETQDQVGKVNKSAAKAYLGKIYLYLKNYDSARILFNDIIATGQTSNGKKYGLVAKYSDLFKASMDNNEESVWAYQSAANTGSVNNANPEFDLNWPYNTGADGPGNCCSFFQPSFSMGNAFRVDATGLPVAGELITDMGIGSDQKFRPDSGFVDPRLDHSIGRRYIPYLDWIPFPGKDWIRNQPNAGPYATKKYVYYKSDKGSLQDNTSWTPGYAAMNYTIIRFADVLLMAAEVEIEKGNLPQAMIYTNLVRARAANPADFVKGKLTGFNRDDKGKYNYKSPILDMNQNAGNYVIAQYTALQFTDQATARNTVRMERLLELNGEGHRFYDLVRWGIAKQTLDAYLNYEKNKVTLGAFTSASFTNNQDELIPIPQSQIDLLGADILKQNPGY